MKKKYILLLVLSSMLGFSQIPAGYYSSATGTGYTLKTQLSQIIDNNTNSNGTASYGGLWTLYTQSPMRDNYYENNGSLLDIYSENPNGTDAYEYTTDAQQCDGTTPSAEGGCYNREHIIPQSVFSSDYPMYSDAHFVLPSDNRVNGWRNNFPFGRVVTTTAVAATNSTVSNASTTPVFTTNGSRLGQNINSGYSAGYSGVVFEPIDEFKGDVARAILYFATRYETQIPTWNYVMFDGSSNKVFTNPFLEILKVWHIQDPVSPYEIAKNNQIYYNFQGNRNPFIDNPSYVSAIWGASLSTDSFELIADINVYPNPSNDQKITIKTENELDEIQIININGQIIQQISKPNRNQNNYTVENIPHGFYFLKLSAENKSIVKKIVIN